MRFEACERYDADRPCGAQANMAKLLAADASSEAGRACMQFHGGLGFAADFDIGVTQDEDLGPRRPIGHPDQLGDLAIRAAGFLTDDEG